MLEIGIMGFLFDESLNGYELKKRLSRLAGYYIAISDGSLYPAIKRLEKRGWLVREKENSSSSRISYLLKLTERGREEFIRMLRNPSDIQITDRNKYFTILTFLHILQRHDQLAVLKRRYEFISGGKGFFYDDDKPISIKDIGDRFQRGMYEIAAATSRFEKQWLIENIDELETGTI